MNNRFAYAVAALLWGLTFNASIVACFAQPLTVKYDQFKNETIVHTPSESTATEMALQTGAPTPMLAVRFEGRNANVDGKAAAMLFFLWALKAPADELCYSVDLLVDAQRFPKIKFTKFSPPNQGPPTRLFAAPISVELLTEILAAKSVEFQLCTQVGYVPAVSRMAMQKALTTKGTTPK